MTLTTRRDAGSARLSRIAPEIPVSTVREAIEHYEGRLEFRIVMETPAEDYAILERDDIALHLFQDNGKSHSPSASTSLRTNLNNCSRKLCSAAPVYRKETCRNLGKIANSA
jgi:hypothetical protein